MNQELKLIVCVKQVPAAAELALDPGTGKLGRDKAEGMMNPACRHALEAALGLKEKHGARITIITMGPPGAEEVLRLGLALGADRGVLLTDPRMAGADTSATSYTLGRAIRTVEPEFDLILCGCQTSDSETGQVGPQLAEELQVPSVAYVDRLEIDGRVLNLERRVDNFLEVLELDLPGLVTVTTRNHAPRHVALEGLETAFGSREILRLDAPAAGAEVKRVGQAGSATRILRLYSPSSDKQALVLTGSPKKIVERLLDQFSDRLGGLIGRDLNVQR